MNLAKGIAIGAGALILYNLFSRRMAAGTLNFLPGPVKSFRIDGATPIITVGLLVQNTSNQNYTINSLAGTVYTNSNGKNWIIGNVSSFVPQVITQNSQSLLFVDLRLMLIGVVSDMINYLSVGDQFSQDISLNAIANVSGLQVPFNFNYKVAI